MGSSAQPWESDRSLTLETASAVLRSCFPEVRSEDLKRLGSGWEFDAFLSGDDRVFRFPRRADVANLFEQERRVHDLVIEVLPAGIAVPRVELMAPPTPLFPYPVAGHRHIAGTAADKLETSVLPVLAVDLGAALGAIHSVPVHLASAAGLGEVEPEEAGRSAWTEMGQSAALRLRGVDPTVDLALDWLDAASFPIAPYPGPPRLIHQDLGPEHLIVDPRTGHLVGILDWTDACLGDPARDFVFLVTWRGWDYAEEVLRAYTGAVDPSFRERLRELSRFLSLMWLGIAVEAGLDPRSHIDGVRRAFSPPSIAS